MNQMIISDFFTPEKIDIYQSMHASNLAAFWRQRWRQKCSRLSKKFEVWVSCEAVYNIFDRFCCLIFENETQPFARLTKYRIYNQ